MAQPIVLAPSLQGGSVAVAVATASVAVAAASLAEPAAIKPAVG